MLLKSVLYCPIWHLGLYQGCNSRKFLPPLRLIRKLFYCFLLELNILLLIGCKNPSKFGSTLQCCGAITILEKAPITKQVNIMTKLVKWIAILCSRFQMVKFFIQNL